MTNVYHLNWYRLLDIKSFVSVILTQLDLFTRTVYFYLIILLNQALISFLLFDYPLGFRLFDHLVCLQGF